MGFSTIIFVFAFLPISLILIILADKVFRKCKIKFLTKMKINDLCILTLNLFYYGWCCGFNDIVNIIIYIIFVYFIGIIIKYCRKNKKFAIINKKKQNIKKINLDKIFLLIGVVILTFILCIGKCFESYKHVWTPLGLSFIIFSSISYLVDIYRNDAETGSFIDCALYISFFPKIISGPIIVWKEFKIQLDSRRISIDKCVTGINRIIIGLAKKIILADTFGSIINSITISSSHSGIDSITAFFTVFLYMLQIYYDFSGYSDMVIGISNVIGFDFDSNFNFPYRSTSITEFWRRWHISLGNWFKEYVYIPLGGNKNGLNRTLINLFIVFTLTGIWHGVGWKYLLWGCINGIFVLIERIANNNQIYKKIPKIIKWNICFNIVMFGWCFFRFDDISSLIEWFKIVFGKTKFDNILFTYKYYLNAKIISLSIIGFIGATILGNKKIYTIYSTLNENNFFFVFQEICLMLLFVISLTFLVNSTYSPFIYFQY